MQVGILLIIYAIGARVKQYITLAQIQNSHSLQHKITNSEVKILESLFLLTTNIIISITMLSVFDSVCNNNIIIIIIYIYTLVTPRFKGHENETKNSRTHNIIIYINHICFIYSLRHGWAI